MVIFNALQTSLSAGIGRYCYGLSKAIYEQRSIEFKIIIRSQDKNLYSFAADEDLIVVDNVNNSKDRNFYEQFVLPGFLHKKYKNAAIHQPDSVCGIFHSNPTIVTVHDLAFRTRKNDFNRKTALWKNFITNITVKNAERIICITNFTKSEVEKYYPKASNKLDVVYNGFDNFAADTINENMIVNEKVKGLTLPYILTVSTISPRKNIDGLIRAFNKIKDHIPHKLVVAGVNGWRYDNIFTLVNEFGIDDRVIFTGKVNDDELKYLYKNADMFVYPSFYEGFGLPPLEAMSYGVPCIVSCAASIPEVVGDAALLVNPNDYEDISNSIKLLNNREESKNEYKQKGLMKVQNYSWTKCAVDTIKVYERI